MKTVQVNFTDGAVRRIERLRHSYSDPDVVNPGNVIEDALALYEWALNETLKGRQLVSWKRGGGPVEQVVPPFQTSHGS